MRNWLLGILLFAFADETTGVKVLTQQPDQIVAALDGAVRRQSLVDEEDLGGLDEDLARSYIRSVQVVETQLDGDPEKELLLLVGWDGGREDETRIYGLDRYEGKWRRILKAECWGLCEAEQAVERVRLTSDGPWLVAVARETSVKEGTEGIEYRLYRNGEGKLEEAGVLGRYDFVKDGAACGGKGPCETKTRYFQEGKWLVAQEEEVAGGVSQGFRCEVMGWDGKSGRMVGVAGMKGTFCEGGKRRAGKGAEVKWGLP